jgi:hypothetical protein
MCAASLKIVNRTVMVATNPDRTEEQVDELIGTIRDAAAEVL